MIRLKRFLQQVLFLEILVGMAATLKHLFVRSVTIQYPREKRELPNGYRGFIALLRYDDGTDKCVGCDLCTAACPSRVITVISAEVDSRSE